MAFLLQRHVVQTIRPIIIRYRFHIQSQKCRLGFTLHNYDQTLIIPKLVVRNTKMYVAAVFCWTPNAKCTVCPRSASPMFAWSLLLFVEKESIWYITFGPLQQIKARRKQSWVKLAAGNHCIRCSAFSKIPLRKCMILKFSRRDLGEQVKHIIEKSFIKQDIGSILIDSHTVT